MSQLYFHSIRKFFGYCKHDITEIKESIPKVTMLTYFDASSNLEQILKSPLIEGWDSTKKLIAIYSIANIIYNLHKDKIIHGDLTPSNILIDKNYIHLIMFFGLSKKSSSFNHYIEKLKDKSVYMAPELFMSDPVYSEKVDVYSFGVILYELLHGQIHKSRYKSDLSISEFLMIKMSKNRPDISRNLHPIFADLIKRCCDVSIDSRPDFQTICSILIGAIKRREKLLEDIDFGYVENYMLNLTKNVPHY